ncbi:SnoaL-like domain-containing protein [Hwangdonia sp.]|uniref:SnoaL-like domain-containing protein n=1 Tax=Hwangdonia sp. TaxID=1883432 RepID=UPI003AB4DEDC
MEQSLNEIFSSKNEMVKKGQIVDATEKYFASNAKTIDFDGMVTNGKSEMLTKMLGFAGAITNVNGITLHHASLNGNVSFSEFTFDFDMKDGSKILWHEIIRSVWENGKIIEEQYFKS